MFRVRTAAIVFSAVLLGGGVPPAAAATPIERAIEQTGSDRLSQREAAFAVLSDTIQRSQKTRKPVDDAVRIALVRLLEREAGLEQMERRPEPRPEDPETFGDYLFSLIRLVAALKDPRSVDVLCSEEIMTTGNMALRGLAGLGHPAALCVARASRDKKDPIMRTAISLAAGYLFDNSRELAESDVERLLIILKKAAHDRDPNIRTAALHGLVASRDPACLALARDIASSDPYFVKLRNWSGYPVRDRARSELSDVPLP